MNRKIITAWCCYDFANSIYPAVIIATIFGVYFTRTIVGNESGLGDLWWGRVSSVSMAVVAITSPLLGSIADSTGSHKKFLFAYTYLTIACVILFTTIKPGMIFWGFLLATLSNIGFEGALTHYNTYLPSIAPQGRRGFVSGLGFGVGYAGSAAGLLVVFPLVRQEKFDLIWLVVAGFFSLFSLPTFLSLPADSKVHRRLAREISKSITGFRHILSNVSHNPNLRRFLLAFFVYIDGVNTTIFFAGIYAVTTLGFSLAELIYLFLTVQISALVGALTLAKPTDILGPKCVITITLLLWTGIVMAAYFVDEKSTFFVITLLAGIGLGAVQSASRALMSTLIPAGKEGELFGFYTFCGKSSSIVGPLIFGSISQALGGNQRAAILSVVAFFLVGLVLLQRVVEPVPQANQK